MNEHSLDSGIYFNGQKILQELEEQFTSAEDVQEYAEYLGIDLSNEDHLSWIAEKGLKSRLPDYFLPIEDKQGRIYFFNTRTGVSSWEHPADSECKDLLQKARKPNPSDSQATLAGESIPTLEDLSLKSDDQSMSLQSERNFLKKVVPPLQQPRSVRFDIQSPASPGDASSEEADPELDDMIERFGLMDASSLSPVFIHSPEPEDVNSLLRLTNQSDSLLRGSSAIGRSRPVSAASPLTSSAERKSSFLKPLEPLVKKNGLVTPASIASASLEARNNPRMIPKQYEKNLVTPDTTAITEMKEMPFERRNFEDELKEIHLNKEQELDQHKKEIQILADDWAKERVRMENEHKHELEMLHLQLVEEMSNEKIQIEDSHRKELSSIEIEFNLQKAKLLEENKQNLDKLKKEHDVQFSDQKSALEKKNKLLFEQTEKEFNSVLEKNKIELEASHRKKLEECNLILSQETEKEQLLKKSLEMKTEFEEQLNKQKLELENNKKQQLLQEKEQLALKLANELKQLEIKHKNELANTQRKLSEDLKSEQNKLETENKNRLQVLQAEFEAKFLRERTDLENIHKGNLEQASTEINDRLSDMKLKQENDLLKQMENIEKEFSDQLAIKKAQLQVDFQKSLDALKAEPQNININQSKIMEIRNQDSSTISQKPIENFAYEVPNSEPLVASSPTPSQQQQDRDLLEMLGTLDKHLKLLDEKVDLLHQKPSHPETLSKDQNANHWEEDSSADETLNNPPIISPLNDKEEIVHLKELLDRCQHRIVQIEGSMCKSTHDNLLQQPRQRVAACLPQENSCSGKRKIKKKVKLTDVPLCHCDHRHCCAKKTGYQDGVTKRAKKLLKHMDREAVELSRLEYRHTLGHQMRHRQYVDASSTSSSSTNSSIPLNRHLLPYQSLAMRMAVQGNNRRSGRSLSGSHLQGDNRLRQAWLHCFGEQQTAPVLPTSFVGHDVPRDGSWENNFEMHSRDWWTQKIRNVREAVKECEDKRLSFNLNK